MVVTPDGGPLPRIVDPGDRVEATIPMTKIVARWDTDLRIQLFGWVETADGRRREPWQSVYVNTPPRHAVEGTSQGSDIETTSH
jgi:hypothetical protein